eukprot:7772242-Pyramimonas_sp.AAC.1
MNGDIFAAFSNAGEDMVDALRCAEEYDILLNRYLAMHGNGEEVQKAAKEEVEEKEKELHEMGDHKTAKEKGEQQPNYLKALDFVDKWSGNMQLFNVRRRSAGWDTKKENACSCGLDFPEKLRWKGPSPNSRGK